MLDTRASLAARERHDGERHSGRAVDRTRRSGDPCAAFVALEEKALSYELQEVAMHRTENRAPEYARRSLTARIPMLRHRDFFLSESSAIAASMEGAPVPYPDSTYEPALRQPTPKPRSHARW